MFGKKKKAKEELEKVERELYDRFVKQMNEYKDEPFIIKIEHKKTSKKGPLCQIEGGRMTLLINLAGIKKCMLEKLNCTDEEFEFIESMIGRIEEEEVDKGNE